jgi:hypothetical protein
MIVGQEQGLAKNMTFNDNNSNTLGIKPDIKPSRFPFFVPKILFSCFLLPPELLSYRDQN